LPKYVPSQFAAACSGKQRTTLAPEPAAPSYRGNGNAESVQLTMLLEHPTAGPSGVSDKIICPRLHASAGPLQPITVLLALRMDTGVAPFETMEQELLGAMAAWHFMIAGGLAVFWK
jgi:hypothetical protein